MITPNRFATARARAAALLLSAVFLLMAVSLPPAARALDLKAKEYTLENGMRVVVIPDHRAPVVTHMVWYSVGAADEPENGKSGLAHFLEHLMFKGTKKIKPGEFSRIIKRHGGEDNAFTTRDYTAYFQRIAKQYLPLVMEMEADRMQNLQLSEKDVATEREVIKEERRMRTGNSPRALFAEQMEAALYVAHPYRRPVIGWMDDVSRLRLADAMGFYRRFYTPANAILVVAGDVEPDAVRKLAEKYYGKLINTAPKARHIHTREPKPLAARRIVMRDARIRAPIIHRLYLAPSYGTARGADAYALEVFAQALGEGPTSVLYKTLVVKEKIATWAGAWYSGDYRDNGSFGVYASPAPGVSMRKLERRIDEILADVLKNGLPGEAIARARNSLTSDAVYSLDSQSSLARLVGEALSTGLALKDVREWESRILAVTPDQVRAAAARVIRPERSVTGLLLKAETPPAAAASSATASREGRK